MTTLRASCLSAIRAGYRTTDAIAAHLDEPVERIRNATGKLRDFGLVRRTPESRNALVAVYEATTDTPVTVTARRTAWRDLEDCLRVGAR